MKNKTKTKKNNFAYFWRYSTVTLQEWQLAVYQKKVNDVSDFFYLVDVYIFVAEFI